MDKLDPLYTTESIHNYDSPHYLNFADQFWRRRQPWLESQGYMLRPRFRYGWVPSWTMGKTRKRNAEDAIEHWSFSALDAVRMSDGKLVYLKRVELDKHGPLERDITLLFSSEPHSSDPHNHCVPVLDVLYRSEEQCSYLVLPALRPFNSPDFLTVGEAVDFFKQIFEGLLYMHNNFVAHRDCCGLNIMMDPSQMYPDLFHPADVNRDKDFQGHARHKTRTECWPKYYLIDFGLSRTYDGSREEWPPLEPVLRGIDKSVPEYQNTDEPQNPFPADVYYIGNLIRNQFLQNFNGLSFMNTLVLQMVHEDPNRRPSMRDVVTEFRGVCGALTDSKLKSRLAKRGEFPTVKWWRASAHIARQFRYPTETVAKNAVKLGKAAWDCRPEAQLAKGQQYISEGVEYLTDASPSDTLDPMELMLVQQDFTNLYQERKKWEALPTGFKHPISSGKAIRGTYHWKSKAEQTKEKSHAMSDEGKNQRIQIPGYVRQQASHATPHSHHDTHYEAHNHHDTRYEVPVPAPALTGRQSASAGQPHNGHHGRSTHHRDGQPIQVQTSANRKSRHIVPPARRDATLPPLPDEAYAGASSSRGNADNYNGAHQRHAQPTTTYPYNAAGVYQGRKQGAKRQDTVDSVSSYYTAHSNASASSGFYYNSNTNRR